jgi:hypothetical protein
LQKRGLHSSKKLADGRCVLEIILSPLEKHPNVTYIVRDDYSYVDRLVCDLLQVWSSLLIYRKILDAIEDNDYDNFTKRAFVGRTKKLLTLPLAYSKAQPMSSLIFQ